MQTTVTTILDNGMFDPSATKDQGLLTNLGQHIGSTDLTEVQAENFSKFLQACANDQAFELWAQLSNNQKNLLLVHPFVRDFMVKIAGELCDGNRRRQRDGDLTPQK